MLTLVFLVNYFYLFIYLINFPLLYKEEARNVLTKLLS